MGVWVCTDHILLDMVVYFSLDLCGAIASDMSRGVRYRVMAGEGFWWVVCAGCGYGHPTLRGVNDEFLAEVSLYCP